MDVLEALSATCTAFASGDPTRCVTRILTLKLALTLSLTLTLIVTLTCTPSSFHRTCLHYCADYHGGYFPVRVC